MKHTLLPTHAFKNKAVLLINLILLSAMYGFAQQPLPPQSQQKWNTNGNSASSTEFIGTTNNTSLIFKTNNLKALEIDPAGDIFIKKLSGQGDGIIKHDQNGKIERIPFNNSFTQVLSSSGVWKEISTFTGLQVNNNDIIQTTTGNFGIGTSSPQAKLDVFGNASVSGALYTSILKLGTLTDNLELRTLPISGGGMVLGIGITPRPFPSCVPAYTSDNVQMNRLTVTTTSNNNVVDIRNDGSNAYIDFGHDAISSPNPTTALKINSSCSSNTTLNENGGNIYMCNSSTGKVGIGTNSPTAKLDVNGNLRVASLSTGGVVQADPNGVLFTTPLNTADIGLWHLAGNGTDIFNANATGNVGIGTNAPTQKLEVSGTGRFGNSNGRTDIGFNSVHSYVDGSAPLLLNYYSGQDVGICTGTNGNVYMCTPATSNVGIGTNTAYKKLTVNGDVSFANYNISGGGNSGDGMNGLEILGNNQTPTKRGISLDPNGALNFFINASQLPGAFNFKNGYDGTTLMRVCADGNVGIGLGVQYPNEKLEISGGNILIDYHTVANDIEASLYLGNINSFIKSNTWGVSINNAFFVQNFTGNVGIGTDFSSSTADYTYKLAVNGKIRAKALKVEPGWADFVFDKNYHLTTIAEVEQYIKKYGHLPEIPSAKEIEKNGVDVGEQLKLQMQKIEELTLYIIEQNKRIEALETQQNKK